MYTSMMKSNGKDETKEKIGPFNCCEEESANNG
jgi:hypothetical protein